MFRSLRLFAAALTVGAGLLLSGCESSSEETTPADTSRDSHMDMHGHSHEGMPASSGTTTAQPTGAMSDAVMCDVCKTMYVRVPYTVPGYEGPRVVGYRSQKVTSECPACRKAAEDYFASGKKPPEMCPDCRGNLSVMKPQ